MSPSPLEAWRSRRWAILSGGAGPGYAEAAALLHEGLAGLGVEAEARSSIEWEGDRCPIILDASAKDSSGYRFRLGAERVELYGDSERALPLAAAALLEALGGQALAPGSALRGASSIGEPKTAFSSAPPFPRSSLVLRALPAESGLEAWKAWALARGFGEISLPAGEFRLSGGGQALAAAAAEAGARGATVLPDFPAAEAAERIHSLAAEAGCPASGLRVLARAGGVPAFVDAWLEVRASGEALPLLVVDEGERCRAHALDDEGCERNASLFGESLDASLKRWKAAGGKIALRFRYDDDSLFPVPCPPQASLIARDLAWTAKRGAAEIEYLASIRLPSRPSLNAWVFSSLASPPPRAGAEEGPLSPERLGKEAEAARAAFFGIRSAAEKTAIGGRPPAAALDEYYACLEEAWAAALDRSPEAEPREDLAPFGGFLGSAKEFLDRPPAWPLDCWEESLSRQEERALALSEAYGKLDRCAELLGSLPAEEEASFRAQEAAIELSGTLRALYAEIKRSGSPGGLAYVADGALALLERKLAGLFPTPKLPAQERRFLDAAYRFRLAAVYRLGGRGPIGLLRSALFRAGLRASYR